MGCHLVYDRICDPGALAWRNLAGNHGAAVLGLCLDMIPKQLVGRVGREAALKLSNGPCDRAVRVALPPL